MSVEAESRELLTEITVKAELNWIKQRNRAISNEKSLETCDRSDELN